MRIFSRFVSRPSNESIDSSVVSAPLSAFQPELALQLSEPAPDPKMQAAEEKDWDRLEELTQGCALHWLCQQGRTDDVRAYLPNCSALLVKEKQDNAHSTPLGYATEAKKPEIVALLEDELKKRQGGSGRLPFPVRQLVFEGGGAKGTAYVGVLQYLEEMKLLAGVEKIGGASAGAITAALLGIGCSVEELRHVLLTEDFGRFQDSPLFEVKEPQLLQKASTQLMSGASGSSSAAGNAFHFWQLNKEALGKVLKDAKEGYGVFRGQTFLDWLSAKFVEQRLPDDLTFEKLAAKVKEQKVVDGVSKRYRLIYLLGVNLSRGCREIFSHEHTPKMSIRDAVRISMSIPVAFQVPRELDHQIYVDGGLLDNYPIDLFDSEHRLNPETLGFRVDSTEEIDEFREGRQPPVKQIQGIKDFMVQLSTTLLKSQEHTHIHHRNRFRTVYIDCKDVGTMDFKLTDKQKHRLVRSGYEATRQHCKEVAAGGHPHRSPKLFTALSTQMELERNRLRRLYGPGGHAVRLVLDQKQYHLQLQLPLKYMKSVLEWLPQCYGVKLLENPLVGSEAGILTFKLTYPVWQRDAQNWITKYHKDRLAEYPLKLPGSSLETHTITSTTGMYLV